ncbi:MAG: SUF system Fe-S cluster assembly regulator [Acidobacteria bacterium]|nr:MAG: SUF system Fe-S cluster assembly regulator [Acidobacteriota bacterium]REJ99554.1 MAG: SUF system Fe-S cluster assembly regulator [Acidobacteriota bacterium]
MIRLTRQTDYGIVLLCQLAADGGGRRNAAELAEATHLPAPMVAKILKQLVHAGLLASRRGAHGGYELARAADSVNVADVIAALEGPIAITECVEESSEECSYEATCRVRGNWKRINRAVHDALASISLDEMARGLPVAAPGAARPAGDGAGLVPLNALER